MSKAAFVTTLVAAFLTQDVAAQALTLTSPDIKPGARIADEQVFGACAGKNISPALSWSGAPKARRAIFALDTDKIDADENVTAASVGFDLHFHKLAKATLTGVWRH